MRLVLRLIVTAAALWLTTLLVPGIKVVPYSDGTAAWVVTFLFVALIFSLVNSTVGVVLKVLSFPLYVLTLGLFSLIINGLLLLIVEWLSRLFGFGLTVEGFWWGVWAAFVMGVFSWLIGLFVRPRGVSS